MKPLNISPRHPRAFTLIELLVVVAIIAILAAIAVPNFLEAQMRSKVSRVKADLRTIATGMESYAVDHHRYPPDWDSGVYAGIPYVNNEVMTYASLTSPVAYLAAVPTDIFNHIDPEDARYFEYYQDEAVQLRDPPPLLWGDTWTARGIKWFAYSYGPDGADDKLAQDQTIATDRSYDPTNGTVSTGDIGRTNGGAVPK